MDNLVNGFHQHQGGVTSVLGEISEEKIFNTGDISHSTYSLKKNDQTSDGNAVPGYETPNHEQSEVKIENGFQDTVKQV